jgi:hypothetical protein
MFVRQYKVVKPSDDPITLGKSVLLTLIPAQIGEYHWERRKNGYRKQIKKGD